MLLTIGGGSITLGDELTVTMDGSNVTATEIDIATDYSTITVIDPATAANFNASTTCGFNDWQVGIPKDVLDSGCGAQSNMKNVIYIDDTADPDVLYSGNSEGTLDSNGYPTDIDLETESERQ